jgi:hypothetical protein
MNTNSTLADGRAAVDIVLGVVKETGYIYSRSPRTAVGWRYMRAIRTAETIDQAEALARAAGISAAVETH